MTRLADYYRARAAEYDAVYAKPERQDDLARLHGLLRRLVAGRRVLEVAAGTGYWTRTMATSAACVTATDLVPETLDVARARAYGPAPVTFRTADAFALDQVPGDFDTAFIGFFWSHVPRADIPRFWAGLRDRLGPGAQVIVLDNLYVPGSSTPVSRTTGAGDTYQLRTLNDGRSYEILKNFPTEDRFTADVTADVPADVPVDVPVDVSAGRVAGGVAVRWTRLEYFWLATCTLR